ncbi:MAG: retron Ec67 family RNA-directed DNA polymerase/endonuclease [Treponema sp.]|nr:retron Ec67 family RNA-directed DNA polymerase/endonuclease [Treponema sp.]
MNYLEKLQNARTTEDFSKLLGLKTGNVSYLLYHYSGNKYYSFQIPKKNGTLRTINAPNRDLKNLQRRLSDYLYNCLEEIHNKNNINDIVSYGYQKNKSIYDNAIIHRNRRYVFNVDLKDFFNSINFGRVRGFFINNKYFKLDSHIATLIAQTACNENMLPQGSPLSPIITILIGGILDNKILKLTHTVRCSYSRYVDDLTFSTNLETFPKDIAYRDNSGNWIIGDKLKKIITSCNFEPNEQKVSMQFRNSRQTSVGLIVNKKVDIPREYYKNVRAMCDSLIKRGNFINKNSSEEHPPTLNQLQGMLNYIFAIKSRNTSVKVKNHYPNFQNLYINFLIYRYFFANDKPIIFTEGKTDIVYLKCALKHLKNEYPKLISTDGSLNIQFMWINDYLQSVFNISSGCTGSLSLLVQYENFLKHYKKERSVNNVFFLFDHDSGIKPIVSKYKNYDSSKSFFSTDTFPALSVEVFTNVRFIFTHKESDKYIEQYFDNTLLNKEINGKKFTHENNVHDPEHFYGKQVFASNIIKKNQDTINYSEFKPLFTELSNCL